MSAGLRLLFDECCSPRLPRDLRDFYQRDYPGLQIRWIIGSGGMVGRGENSGETMV